MRDVRGKSWLLRARALLETADPGQRQLVEQRWWRLHGVLGAHEFDHACARLSPGHLRDETGAFDEFAEMVTDPNWEDVPVEWLMELAGLDQDG